MWCNHAGQCAPTLNCGVDNFTALAGEYATQQLMEPILPAHCNTSHQLAALHTHKADHQHAYRRVVILNDTSVISVPPALSPLVAAASSHTHAQQRQPQPCWNCLTHCGVALMSIAYADGPGHNSSRIAEPTHQPASELLQQLQTLPGLAAAVSSPRSLTTPAYQLPTASAHNTIHNTIHKPPACCTSTGLVKTEGTNSSSQQPKGPHRISFLQQQLAAQGAPAYKLPTAPGHHLAQQWGWSRLRGPTAAVSSPRRLTAPSYKLPTAQAHQQSQQT
jgi:hypothetical protein